MTLLPSGWESRNQPKPSDTGLPGADGNPSGMCLNLGVRLAYTKCAEEAAPAAPAVPAEEVQDSSDATF